ncbi:MAG: hypothetical protein ACJAS6_000928 [Rickettsiales bacterium]|jgi:hypothetical protein
MLNFDIKKLRLASSGECEDFLKLVQKNKGRKVKNIELKNLSQFEIYSYLLARFGKPNGFQMLLKAPNANNLIHWHWTLMYDESYIDFIGYLSRSEIIVSQINGEIELSNICSLIQVDVNNYREKIIYLKKEFEKWSLFTNPYARFRTFCDKINEKIEINSQEIPALLKNPRINLKEKSGQRSVYSFAKRQEDHINAMMSLASDCLSLNVFLPVMLESFINLLIFILIKPQVRKNKRLYDHYLKSPIDVRILQLNMQCLGFKGDLDKDDVRFKKFHTLMNARNNTLHGNVDLNLYKVCNLYYHDKNIPLFDDISYSDNYPKFLEDSIFRNIPVEKAKMDYKITLNFIEYVLENLEDGKFGQFIKLLIAKRCLGWDGDRKKVSDLLSDYHVDCFMGS